MRKFLGVALAAMLVLTLTGCTWSDPQSVENDGIFRVSMVPDMGGVNDQSFNQSALEGLYEMRDNIPNVQVSYAEPKQFLDFEPILETLADGPSDMILCVGNVLADAAETVASRNRDKNFVNVDVAFDKDAGENLTGITFRAQDAAFLVGYAAGLTTKTNKVGFVGGMVGPVIDQFLYGYLAGVDFAAKERGVTIEVFVQYAESFSDGAKGKAIASRMFSSGCDIVFHAAGGVGYGVFEAAKEYDKLAIGVDRDQSYLAPDNVLTSAVKNVGTAVQIVAKELMNGGTIGGKNYEFGLKERCVGIPENHKNMREDVYQKTLLLGELVESGEIVVPHNAVTYKAFKEILREGGGKTQ